MGCAQPAEAQNPMERVRVEDKGPAAGRWVFSHFPPLIHNLGKRLDHSFLSECIDTEKTSLTLTFAELESAC